MTGAPRFAPETLGSLVAAATRRALASGALVPLDTEGTPIEDAGVRFVVRKALNLRRKDAERERQARGAAPADPFLPPEPDLRVADVSASHVAVLNRFNVLERHLLIVTRAFEHQERWLTREDFTALAACLAGYESLGFYNGGAVAGASQAHKHLQLVPLPLGAEAAGAAPVHAVPPRPPAEGEGVRAGHRMEPGTGPASPQPPPFPTAALIAASLPRDGVAQVAGFPFVAAVTPLRRAAFTDPERAAGPLQDRFDAAMAFAGIHPVDATDGLRQSRPYNLLVTRDWLLAVPRTREHADGVSINALGYAGSLFVRDDLELERLRALGPMRALASVSVSR